MLPFVLRFESSKKHVEIFLFSYMMIYDIYDSTWVSKKKIMLFEWMDRNPVQVWIPICSAPSTLPMGINERVNNTRRISPMTFAKKWTKQQNKTSVIYVTAQMTKVLVLRMQLFVLDRKKSVEHDQQKLILFESVVRQISFLFFGWKLSEISGQTFTLLTFG